MFFSGFQISQRRGGPGDAGHEGRPGSACAQIIGQDCKPEAGGPSPETSVRP